jgi:electron transport complex protein RnfB
MGATISHRLAMKGTFLVEEIDELLPQTQCRRCGFAGCRPYAEAIAEGRAEINQCPPGGEEGIRKLARLLGVSPLPLNTAYGEFKPKAVAAIDEQHCIGCTLCTQACPVDAIVGAGRQMHTIIADECTGCELCVEPCPVDCISMVTAKAGVPEGIGRGFIVSSPVQESEEHEAEKKKAADRARERYQFRLQRLEREKQEREGRFIKKTEAVSSSKGSLAAADLKKATIQAALERARVTQAQTARKKPPKPNIFSS